jgi:hypothetical protein
MDSTTTVDPNDGRPLVLGVIAGIMEQAVPALQTGMNIRGIEPHYGENGQVDWMDVLMRTGRYRVTIEQIDDTEYC